ncbi:hypothetical protein EB118_20645, partial [bacterium]|nr:hypothetical protein [bacterium]
KIDPMITFKNRQLYFPVENRCLASDGRNMRLDECDAYNTDKRQQWTFDGQLQNNWSERCFDNNLNGETCTKGDEDQMWTFDGTNIKDRNGQCITAFYNNDASQKVYKSMCIDGNYQKFKLKTV